MGSEALRTIYEKSNLKIPGSNRTIYFVIRKCQIRLHYTYISTDPTTATEQNIVILNMYMNIIILHTFLKQAMAKGSRKKVLFLVVRPLRGGGVRAAPGH